MFEEGVTERLIEQPLTVVVVKAGVSPVLIGFAAERTGPLSAGLAFVAVPVFTAATLVLLLPNRVSRLTTA